MISTIVKVLPLVLIMPLVGCSLSALPPFSGTDAPQIEIPIGAESEASTVSASSQEIDVPTTVSGFPPELLDQALGLATETRSAVLMFLSDDGRGQGTGWLVNEQFVVTNWHVVDSFQQPNIPLRTLDGRVVTGQVVATTGPWPDLAVLKLTNPVDLPTLKLWLQPLDENTPLLSTGHGLTIGPWTSKVGVFTGPDHGWERIRISIPTTSGDSGSPIMTLEGHVVGVLSGSDLSGLRKTPPENPTIHNFIPREDVGHGPSAQWVANFLDSHDVPYEVAQ